MRFTFLFAIFLSFGCKPQSLSSGVSSLENLASDKKVTNSCGAKSFSKKHIEQIKGPAANARNRLTVMSALGNVPPEIQDGFFSGVEIWLHSDVAAACKNILSEEERAATVESNKVKACWDLKSSPHRVLLGADAADIRHNAVRAVGYFQVNQALSYLIGQAENLGSRDRQNVVEMIRRVEALPEAFAKDTAGTDLPAQFKALPHGQKQMVIYADAFDTVHCHENPDRVEALRFKTTLRTFLGRSDGFGLQQSGWGGNNYGQFPSGFMQGRYQPAVDSQGNAGTQFVNRQTGFVAPQVLSYNDNMFQQAFKRTTNATSYVGDVAGRATYQTGQMARSIGSSLNPSNWSWFQ
jgi:hypothetical protein